MISALPMPASPLRIAALRSLAVNVPLAATLVAAFAGISSVMSYRSPGQHRREFLRALAASDASDATLLAYLDARDPIDMARAALRLPDDPEATTDRPAIRKALAAAL